MKTKSWTSLLVGLLFWAGFTPRADAAAEPAGVFAIADPVRMCRAAELYEIRAKVFAPSLADYGAGDPKTKDSLAQKWVAAGTRWREDICVNKGPLLQTPVLAQIIWDDLNQIGKAWNAVVAAASKKLGDPRFADDALNAQIRYEVERMTAGCGGVPAAGLHYIEAGGPLQSSAFGSYCVKAGVDIRATTHITVQKPKSIKNCVDAHAHDRVDSCGGGLAGDSNGDTDGDGKAEGGKEAPPQPPADPDKPQDSDDPTVFDAKINVNAAKDVAEAGSWIRNIAGLVGAGVSLGLITASGVGAIATALGAIGICMNMGAKGVEAYNRDIIEKHQNKACPSQRFSTGPAFLTNGTGNPITTYELAQECMCQGIGDESAGLSVDEVPSLGLTSLHKSGFCATPGEQKKMDCMQNPIGDDDGVRQDCAKYYRQDNSEISIYTLAQLCDTISCPAGYDPTGGVDSYGAVQCGCATKPLAGGSPIGFHPNVCQFLHCEVGAPAAGPNGVCQCSSGDGPIDPGGPIGPSPDPSP